MTVFQIRKNIDNLEKLVYSYTTYLGPYDVEIIAISCFAIRTAIYFERS